MTIKGIGKFTPRVLMYWLALLLVGCGTLPKMTAPPTPVRDVLLSNETPQVEYGAYGYLVFTKRPSKNEMQRYLHVCEAFVRNLEPVSEYSYIASTSLMPTYWLVVGDNILNKRRPHCQAWVDSYDYPRAKGIASAVSALNSKGPLLVAWNKSFENVFKGEKALILDLSDFSEEDLDRALGIWMDRITRDPAVWQAGFNLVIAKEVFRSFLEKYGDNIVRAISTVNEILG
jgi:hypothetical protein